MALIADPRENVTCISLFEFLFCSFPKLSPLSPLSCDKFNIRYALGEELGSGSSGITRLCIDKVTGEKLACKTIQLSSKVDHPEVSILKHLADGPNIIEFKSAYYTPGAAHLLMEFCNEGSLLKVLKTKRFTEPESACLCKSLMESIKYCHSKNIVHRDITLANILISSSFSMKLADFGLATYLGQGERLKQLVGTPSYVAPEVLKGNYGQEVDIWSSGVVLYAIISGGEFPFSGNTRGGTFASIMTKCVSFQSSAWKAVSPLVKDLIRRMLCHDPEKRLSPEEVLQHEWVLMHTCGNSMKPLDLTSERSCLEPQQWTDDEDFSSSSSMMSFKSFPTKSTISIPSNPRFGEGLFQVGKRLLSAFI